LGDDGGGYKELTEKFPYIMPNARVLQYLRVIEKSDTKTEFDKMFIINVKNDRILHLCKNPVVF
jgi:hypothetical protein